MAAIRRYPRARHSPGQTDATSLHSAAFQDLQVLPKTATSQHGGLGGLGPRPDPRSFHTRRMPEPLPACLMATDHRLQEGVLDPERRI